MTDYEKYLRCLELLRKAAKCREQGKWEKAWALETEIEALEDQQRIGEPVTDHGMDVIASLFE